MSRVIRVLALATAVLLLTSALAYADHSPTFYVQWNQTSSFTGYVTGFGNQGTGSPHQNYLEGTEKCGVCHSVHRAPVPYVAWSTKNSGQNGVATLSIGTSVTPVAGGQYNRLEFQSDSENTQMLLLDSVANACNYCHVYTSIGNKQLYGGSADFINSATGAPGSEWDEGFGHHNACTGCHAQHGVSNNFGNPALYGQYGTFQGPVKTKILRVRAKGSGGPVGSAAAYNWMDEVIVAGSLGKVEAQNLYGAVWANRLLVDDTRVDPLNVPLFPSATDAILGTNTRDYGDSTVVDAQVSAFCTFCHQNYGYASEATVNPNGDRSLFQGPWLALAGTVPNVFGTSGLWYTMNGASAYGAPFKNHPMKNEDALPFSAAGASASVPSQVAYMGSETCRSCHNAGLTNQTGFIVESYPHFTPGYFHFVKSGAYQGAVMTNDPVRLGLIPNVLNTNDTAGIANVQAWLRNPLNYEMSTTVQDGQCLKCHVDSTNALGVGKTY